MRPSVAIVARTAKSIVVLGSVASNAARSSFRPWSVSSCSGTSAKGVTVALPSISLARTLPATLSCRLSSLPPSWRLKRALRSRSLPAIVAAPDTANGASAAIDISPAIAPHSLASPTCRKRWAPAPPAYPSVTPSIAVLPVAGGNHDFPERGLVDRDFERQHERAGERALLPGGLRA